MVDCKLTVMCHIIIFLFIVLLAVKIISLSGAKYAVYEFIEEEQNYFGEGSTSLVD